MEPSMQQMQSNTLSVPNFLQYPIVNYLPLFSRSKHSFHCANIGPHSAFCPFGSLRYIQRLTQFSLAQERWTQALYALSSRVDRPVLDTRCSRLESACFALWWLLMRHVDRYSCDTWFFFLGRWSGQTEAITSRTTVDLCSLC